MKPGVPRTDPADPMLSHEHRSVKVVHLIPANVGQFVHGMLENGRVPARRKEQVEYV